MNKKELRYLQRIKQHNVGNGGVTSFIGNFKDITEKAHKAIYTEDPAFLNVMALCPGAGGIPARS